VNSIENENPPEVILSDPEKMEMWLNSLSSQLQSKTWKIRVIITTLETNSFFLKIGGMIKNFEYGTAHAAVLCGPFILSWDDSSLSIPSRSAEEFDGGKSIASIDSGEYDMEKNFIIKTLSRVVTDWNANKTYSVINCNCQHFVDHLLEELGMKNPFHPKMKTFLKSIQTDPQNIQYKYTDSSNEEIVFHTHEELDNYCFERSLNDEDRQLLKAFDRMFWFKYYALVKKDSDLNELKPYIDRNCPFGNPQGSTLI